MDSKKCLTLPVKTHKFDLFICPASGISLTLNKTLMGAAVVLLPQSLSQLEDPAQSGEMGESGVPEG